MPSLYQAMDCLLVSRGAKAGAASTEAMMMELPVIASNWSGNTEFEPNQFLVGRL